MELNNEHLQAKFQELQPAAFITYVTDCYLEHVGGALSSDNMHMLSNDQHTLLAYRYLLDEVMEGGFIQLILNGFAGYVLEGPLPLILRREWGLRDLAKLIFSVRSEYHKHIDELTREMDDEEFMALYEQLEELNELGDDFLDDHQETATPAIARFVIDHAERFVLPNTHTA